jgi:hypothetical protein
VGSGCVWKKNQLLGRVLSLLEQAIGLDRGQAFA